MALTQSYVGTTSVGASAQTPAQTTAYVKAVTIPANSVLLAVEGHMGLTDGNHFGFRVGVWDDNVGAPGVLRVLSPMPDGDALRVGATDRWLGESIGMWFASETDIWIGVHIFDPASTTLSYSSGTGADRTITSGSIWTGETGALGVTVATTSNDFSIRGVVLT